jgi:hypothetical protein
MSMQAQVNSGRQWGFMIAIPIKIQRSERTYLIPRMRLPITLSLVLAVAAPVWAEAPSLKGTLPEDYLPGLKPYLKAAVERSPTTINASIGLAQAEAGRYLQAPRSGRR